MKGKNFLCLQRQQVDQKNFKQVSPTASPHSYHKSQPSHQHTTSDVPAHQSATIAYNSQRATTPRGLQHPEGYNTQRATTPRGLQHPEGYNTQRATTPRGLQHPEGYNTQRATTPRGLQQSSYIFHKLQTSSSATNKTCKPSVDIWSVCHT